MRTFGVEEELLLVDAASGRPVPVAGEVLSADERAGRRGGGALVAEMHQEMIEAITRPTADVLELVREATALRAAADSAARSVGARAVALGTSPLPARPHPTASRRYNAMMSAYGALPRHSLECALHVHVGIESAEEGVAVLDRIRVWLPVLVALTANSPFHHGEDTGHASWRTIAWNQWPNAGPLDVLGTVEAYRDLERRLVRSGVVMDAGMLYFAARLSRAHPTVEVRVADVPLDVSVTATIAALARAMVDTAAAEWRAGLPAPAAPTALLRLASWQAALCGVRGTLLDPETGESAPAEVVTGRLLEHVMGALEANGDDGTVVGGMGAIATEGTGADIQRRSLRSMSRLDEVVRMAAERTVAEHSLPIRPIRPTVESPLERGEGPKVEQR